MHVSAVPMTCTTGGWKSHHRSSKFARPRYTRTGNLHRSANRWSSGWGGREGGRTAASLRNNLCFRGSGIFLEGRNIPGSSGYTPGRKNARYSGSLPPWRLSVRRRAGPAGRSDLGGEVQPPSAPPGPAVFNCSHPVSHQAPLCAHQAPLCSATGPRRRPLMAWRCTARPRASTCSPRR